MNERIQELEQQAMSIVLNGNDPDSDVDKMYIPSEFTKKFAELIVKECCQTVERRYKYSNGTPISFWEMSQDVQDLLKKHFGVEE